MSELFFIGDLHLGHNNILKFSSFRNNMWSNIDEMHRGIVDIWNSKVSDKDTVWVLGDVTFNKKYLYLMCEMRGIKNLVLGNHDNLSIDQYTPYFNKIFGAIQYKEFMLTHIPIHESELEYRCKYNIHGHMHKTSLKDKRYINVNCDQNECSPISLEEIYERIN